MQLNFDLIKNFAKRDASPGADKRAAAPKSRKKGQAPKGLSDTCHMIHDAFECLEPDSLDTPIGAEPAAEAPQAPHAKKDRPGSKAKTALVPLNPVEPEERPSGLAGLIGGVSNFKLKIALPKKRAQEVASKTVQEPQNVTPMPKKTARAAKRPKKSAQPIRIADYMPQKGEQAAAPKTKFLQSLLPKREDTDDLFSQRLERLK